MKFSDLAIGDLFQFLEVKYTYKKVGAEAGMPMCSRMNHIAEVKPETEIIRVEPSSYSRELEEDVPDFEQLAWELECEMAELDAQYADL
ncbi:hypothetical protein ACN23B_30545 (plasmid) [Anabaena sp. FACHB-709]|uniref:Uncharacterized protein n=2 Tax=Nostocaceae TaxID=1162 RepID=A0A1Z4KX25_ANAVA|nr:MULTISPECIES: hypothetical protein [Nostocaceae]BAY42339.1 hypothetical protein NIES2111_67620 [Nostoc sp. NIES-2111]BAY73478.1 hypothetical protein NIES23_63300 [Trichormus variabilis NIES-23]MBD2174597.1 hypothetical protein [Anabaena cylindrica FACHB-318]MBD2266352.1 hypothetical protein [Anabaena sp. FACHB-709]MBD2275770.1 hypothetical protein [Nostoc sp. PCC 7120 = FACHB-418]